MKENKAKNRNRNKNKNNCDLAGQDGVSDEMGVNQLFSIKWHLHDDSVHTRVLVQRPGKRRHDSGRRRAKGGGGWSKRYPWDEDFSTRQSGHRSDQRYPTSLNQQESSFRQIYILNHQIGKFSCIS